MTIYKPSLVISFVVGSYDFFSLQSPVLPQDFAPTFLASCNGVTKVVWAKCLA